MFDFLKKNDTALAAQCAELVDKVREAVLAIAPFEDVQVTRAGCTVSMHCGPNTLGVLFCKK